MDIMVFSPLRAQETKKRWATMLEKQDRKIELETAMVAVKKRKEDFLILKTDMSGMDEEVKAAHTLIHDAILQEMGIRRPAASYSAGDQVQ
jgi:hypothetical protein